MFEAIKIILAAFEKGVLTCYGVEMALEDYFLFGGDGVLSVESGQLMQSVHQSDK